MQWKPFDYLRSERVLARGGREAAAASLAFLDIAAPACRAALKRQCSIFLRSDSLRLARQPLQAVCIKAISVHGQLELTVCEQAIDLSALRCHATRYCL